MCTYSMVHEFMHQHIPDDWWTRPRLNEYEELIRRLKEIDDKLGLPDCNPNKGEFLEEIRRRLDAIEKKIGIDEPQPQTENTNGNTD